MIEEAKSTTNIVSGQKVYPLPTDIQPIKDVEVYNEKKKEWRKVPFNICLEITGRKLKTDKTIRITYDQEKDPQSNHRFGSEW